MSLSPAERAAGRWWRDRMLAGLAEQNDLDPPDVQPPPFIRHYRHLCEAVGGKSVSFDYAEVYVLSPELGGATAGRFAFIYHEGKCAGCGFSARSRTGWVADASTREPSGRKVVQGG